MSETLMLTHSRVVYLVLFVSTAILMLRGLRWTLRKLIVQAQRCFLAVLAAGPVPKHIAFVMDGNRRYARTHKKKVQQGHVDGFGALHSILDACLQMNIQCVTAYAFSLENFKRSPDEVDALMSLAEEKLLELCTKGDLLDAYGVRLNVIGRVGLLPKHVQKAVRKAEDMTRHNDRAILNLCMPYTSRDEIATAVEDCVRAGLRCDIDPDTYFTKEEIDRRLMLTTRGSPPLDILVRTSGVKRLSDFLLWQCCENTQIQFRSTYWPDFGLWDFVPIILDYQRKIWSRRISS